MNLTLYLMIISRLPTEGTFSIKRKAVQINVPPFLCSLYFLKYFAFVINI